MTREHAFVLLGDFRQAYDRFDFSNGSLPEKIEEEILSPFRSLLAHLSTSFTYLPSHDIRAMVKRGIPSNSFVVAFDSRACLTSPDFSIEVTRTCFQMEDAANGPYFRLPRENAPQLMSQCMQLKEMYSRPEHHERPVVLFDDGIGSGDTLADMIGILMQFTIDVAQIVVVLNPSNKTSIRNIPITTLYPAESQHLWLSERDLIWGLPRSGLSFAEGHAVSPRYGIPYTLDEEMIVKRIGFAQLLSREFRAQALYLNSHFWRLHEIASNRPYSIHDCQRLRFLAHMTRLRDLPISAFIQEVSHVGYNRRSLLREPERRRIRWIVTDLDGTALDPDGGFPMVAETIAEDVVNSGGRFMIATSRPPSDIRHLLSGWKTPVTVIALDGALTSTWEAGAMAISDEQILSGELATLVVERMTAEAEELELLAFSTESSGAEVLALCRGGVSQFEKLLRHQNDPRLIQVTTSFADFEAALLLRSIRAVAWFDKSERVHAFESALLARLNGIGGIRVLQYDESRMSGFRWVEVAGELVNKGAALQRLMKSEALPPEIIALGNGSNDLSMFELATRCYCPAGSETEVMRLATCLPKDAGTPFLEQVRQELGG